MRKAFQSLRAGKQCVRVFFCLFLLGACFEQTTFAKSKKFEIRGGDRVAFIGGAFMERENEEGYLETMLTRDFLDKNVTFRNFGWSGDTVETFVQPSFEPRPKYVPSLLDWVSEFRPTVIVLSYGMMESFKSAEGLSFFTKNYNVLIDKFVAASRQNGIEPVLVFIAPFQQEAIGKSSKEAEGHNKDLRLYVDAIAKIALERNGFFVNLFASLRTNGKKPLTSNGVHLNSRGYQEASAVMEKELGLDKAKFESGAVELLRTAIRDKNKQWWFHYRTMNSEYVYRNGSRFQDKIGDTQKPLDQEITEFARLAEQGDQQIASIRKNILQGEQASKKVARPTSAVPENVTAPDPELERQSFQVAEGFEVNLFAADPLINKPIQMSFDERGRLFVATTTLYPQIKPGEKATDKIIVLEDVDHDGRADTTKVFADGLYIPTGVLPGDGGLYTFDDTTFLHFRDTDGDGRADEKEIVLSGFGTEDSHHKGHVLRYGPGGNIYFNQGVFLHSTIETAHGIVHQSGNWLAGIFEYQPQTKKFDVYLANSVPPNPWGHYWNRWGFDFHIDSSGQQGSNFILPTANKKSSAIPVPGGAGKLAGGELISGRHFPDEWQGNLIAAPFKENRVARWAFLNDGSGYALKSLEPLIVSTDSAFRPVDMRMGPDGALYIADWYNPLIGHMQYHFRDPGRDFTHGRIWRVTAKNRPLVPRFDFNKASVTEILEQLKASEDFNRAQAKRVLSERNRKDVLRSLAKWVKNLNSSEPNYDHHRIEALWTYQTLNVVEPELLKSLLRAKTSDARAAATAVLRYWHESIGNDKSLDLLATQIADENARVRLQAVITLSYIPSSRSMKIAAGVSSQPMDPYLEQALKNTAMALEANTVAPLTNSKETLATIAKAQAQERKETAANANREIKDMSRAEMAPWVTEVQKNGNAERGERIFHRAELNCLSCHAVGGAGGHVGPELGAVGSGSTVDYLIESILFPNKVIKDGFQTVEVVTKEDETIVGVKVRESDQELVLKDVTRAEIVIPTSSIKEKKEKAVSLMPTGWDALLKHSELIDLVRFLSELGKPGDYANNPKPVVRRWQILSGVQPEQAFTKKAIPWTTTYALVSGILPLDIFPAEGSALASFEIETTSPGKIQLKLNSSQGLKMWLDETPVPLSMKPILNLSHGTHRVTFLVDTKRRAKGLRVELDETASSSARVQLAEGR